MKQLDFYIGKSESLTASFVWKIIGFSLLLVSLSSWGLAQDIQWENNFGGDSTDIAESIVQTSDGGFAIAGQSYSSDGDLGGNNGSADYWILKLDNAGAIQWEKQMGGSGRDVAESIVQTSDGGFVIAGRSGSSDGDVGGNNGNNDCWIVKLDNTGALKWEKNFGGSGDDVAKSIIKTSDGGFAIAGHSRSSDGDVGGNNGADDYWVAKLDKAGALQWEKNFGGSTNDRARSIVQDSDGGFAIAGSSWSDDGDVGGNNGDNDYWVVKLDNAGDLQWEENFGASGFDFAESIIQTSDGGFAIAGNSTSSEGDVGGNNGSLDYWVVKLDNAGSIEWEQNLGGSGEDEVNSIVHASDSGFAIAGNSESSDNDVSGNNGSLDYWVVKLDSAGALKWENNFGGSNEDKANSIIQTSDGSFAVAGKSGSSDGDVRGNNGNDDYWVVKLGTADPSGMLQNNLNTNFSIYPNPAQKQLKLQTQTEIQSYALHTLTGQKAQSGKLSRKEIQTLDVSNLSPGVYLLEVQGADVVRTKKVVIE